MASLNLIVMALTFLMLNVNGLHDSAKWQTLWREIPKKDVLCFQEIYLTHDQIYSFKLFAQSYDFFISSGSSNSCGVMTAMRCLLGVMAIKMIDCGGRLLVVDVISNETALCIINIYTPNNSKEQMSFFQTLPQYFIENMVLG